MAALIERFSADYVIADKACDAADLLDLVVKRGVESVIPSTPHRNERREPDRQLYRECHLVKCFINKINHNRRMFSRSKTWLAAVLAFHNSPLFSIGYDEMSIQPSVVGKKTTPIHARARPPVAPAYSNILQDVRPLEALEGSFCFMGCCFTLSSVLQ